MVTFWPADSTCTPAETTCMPGCSPAATTASLPSAVATWIGCDFSVMVDLSSTQNAVPCPSLRSALVGSLMTGAPAMPSALGDTYTVAPSGGVAAASSETFTAYVRVTGSALAATSRILPASVVLSVQERTETSEPGLRATTLSS